MNELPLMPPEQLTERESRMLNTLLTPPRKQMPLAIFEKEFLPFLSSVPIPSEVIQAMLDRMKRQTGQEHTVSDLTGNLLNQWMEYHQTPGAPYMYVDVKVGDEVVYTVPPLLDNREVMHEAVDARMLASITNQSSNLSLIHANLADQYVKDNLLPLINPAEPNPEFLKMWNIIYDYHNLPNIKMENGQFKPSAEPVATREKRQDGTVVETNGAISEMDEYD